MPSAKKIGREATASLEKTLSEIKTPLPDMKDDGAELKAAVAPKKAPTFAEAFRAARKDPEAMKRGTFTYGGKSFSTKMANEGAKPAVATRRSVETQAKPATEVKESTRKFVSNLPLKPKAEAPRPATPAKPKGDTYSSGVGGARSAAAQEARKSGKSTGLLDSPFGKWVHKTNVAFQERQKKKYGMAKGGKIDGCAVRGKTRAMRKGK